MNEISNLSREATIIGTTFGLQDLAVGGVGLVVIFLFHTVGVNTISRLYDGVAKKIKPHPSYIAVDLLFGFSVFSLLLLHLLEVLGWTSVLMGLRLTADWRASIYYTANTYTTLGFGTDILPHGWKMLTPIIAVSGLFTFGWTGSVLVGFVLKYNQMRDIKRSGE